MGGAQAMKRIPLIKFPQRHPKTSGSISQPQATNTPGQAKQISFSKFVSSSMPPGGSASLQPKRTPVSEEEIETILLGGSN